MGFTAKSKGPFGNLTLQVCLDQNVESAPLVWKRLSESGRSLNHVRRQPKDDGVEKFNKPFNKLMGTLGRSHVT